MHRWNSFAEVTREFGLSQSITPEQAREILRELWMEHHPDRHGGKFRDANDEERFHALSSAIQFLESFKPVPTYALVHLDELTTLRAQLPILSAPTVGQADSALERATRIMRRHYATPKLTSAIFAGIITLLIGLLGQMKSHPLYRTLENSISNKTSIDERFMDSLSRAEASLQAPREYPDSYWREFRDSIRAFRVNIYSDTTLIQQLAKRDSMATMMSDLIQKSIDSVTNDSLAEQLDESAYRWDEFSRGVRRIYFAYRAEIERDNRRTESTIHQGLFALFSLFALAYVFLWSRERSDQRWVAYLRSDAGLADVYERIQDVVSTTKSPRFSSRLIFSIVEKKRTPRGTQVLFGRTLSPEIVQEVGPAIITLLLERGAIRAEGMVGVDQHYTLFDSSR